ncbi:DNA-primase RepB domain-containing protein [Neoaquamicrobium microcysteis]|nr:DNA-primase RepB domain-containing protein [Mesorhizobium microcysteis]
MTQPTFDLDGARRHLSALTGEPDPVVAFQLFSDADKTNTRLARGLHGRLDDVLPRLTEAQRHGCGVFVSVNETDGRARRKENMRHARALFLDMDGAPLPDTWTVEPHLVVASSCHDGVSKFQCWWFVQPTTKWDVWQKTERALVERYGGDPKCTLTTQVGRLAGFYHLKRPAHPWQVRIVHDAGDVARHTLDDLVEAFGFDLSAITLPRAPHVNAGDRPPPNGWDADFDVLAARRLVSDPDNWTATSDGAVSIYQMACRLRDLGISQGLAVELIREHVPVFPDAWPDDHVERKTAHAYRYGQNDAGVSSLEADRLHFANAFSDDDLLRRVDAEEKARAAAMFGRKVSDHA